MDESVVKLVTGLGYPVFSALAMGWALWRVGMYLVKAHVDYLKENIEQMKAQTSLTAKIVTALPTLCHFTDNFDGFHQSGKPTPRSHPYGFKTDELETP